MRALGKCPTEQELKELIAGVSGDKLDFEQFKAVMSKGATKDNERAAQEIRDALSLFSFNDRISTDLVKVFLTTREDKLELKDIESIIALADENGCINVDKLVHALLS